MENTSKYLTVISTLIYTCNKIVLSLKYIIRLTVILFIPALLSGCAGPFVDSLGKSMISGKTYGEMINTLPPISDGNGRLYFYRTKASTKSEYLFSYGNNYGLAKNPTLCTIDDTAYEIIWEVFRYVDLPVGNHEVTCGIDVLKEGNKKYNYQRGVNKIQISISNTADTFVRVDGAKEKPFFQPILVNREQARKEMYILPHQNGMFVYRDGKLSQE